MREAEKAKAIVNKIYQPMGYLVGLQMNSKQMWNWASERAIEQVNEIIEALKTTTGHCELRRLDQQEVEMDFAFWERVKVAIEADR